jgi:oligoribonuclease NrnB/cAMP/cGMP phosphodiesterase (DHH superfamily)
MNIKLFTHNDLDGVASYQVLKNSKIALDSTIDVTYTTPYKIYDELYKFFSGDFKNYELLYITDLGLKEDSAKLVDAFCYDFINKVILYDHHETSLDIGDKYPWAKVEVYRNDYDKTCGAQLFMDNLVMVKDITKYINNVRMYDTWTFESNKTPGRYNALFYILGIDGYNKFILEDGGEIKGIYKNLIDIDERNRDRYIERVKYKFMEFEGHETAVAICDSYINDVAEFLLRNFNIDIAIIININRDRMSLRANIDIADITRKYGGGGHSKSGGTPVIKNILKQYMEDIL